MMASIHRLVSNHTYGTRFQRAPAVLLAALFAMLLSGALGCPARNVPRADAGATLTPAASEVSVSTTTTPSQAGLIPGLGGSGQTPPPMTALDHVTRFHATPPITFGAPQITPGPTRKPMDHSAMGHDMSNMTVAPATPSSPAPMDHAAMGHSMSGMQSNATAKPTAASPSDQMDHSARGPDMSKMNAGSKEVLSSSGSPRTSREIAALSPAETLKADPQDAPQPESLKESRKAAESGSMMNMGHGTMNMEPESGMPEGQATKPMDHGTMKMDGAASGGADARNTPTPGRASPSGSAHDGHSAPSLPVHPISPSGQPAGGQPTSSQAGDAYYTCLMHPDVIRSEPGRCPKCGMTLVERKK